MSQLFPTAVGHFQAGRYDAGVAICRQILAANPRHVDAFQLLGLCLSRIGRGDEAAAAVEESLRIAPRQPSACNNLGEIYRQLGRLDDAERVLREALRQQPRFAEAAFNLGNVLKEQNRIDEAIAAYQQAIEWKPDHWKCHLNLANTLRQEGRLPRSVLHYRECLRFMPPRSDVLLSFGGALSELGEHAEALEAYRKAAAIDPDNSEVDRSLGNARLARGEIAEARPHFAALCRREPQSLLQKLRHDSLCEPVAPGVEFIDDYRRRLFERLQELCSSRLTIDVEQLHGSGAEPPMPLTYQGRDDRPLKEFYAGLFAERLQPLETPKLSGRPRVGIVVTSGHEGVYSECLGRLVARLSRRDMDVSVVCSRSGRNILKFLMPDADIDYFRISERVDVAANELRDAGFDLLHYWEIGTDSLNYFLPLLRPAPVQSTCWGWPVTSGQPFVQHFVSSRLIEPEGAAAHYRENLVLLDTLPTYYLRPPVPQPLRDRSAMGLPEGRHLYLCSQNLRKYHPDFDAVLGDILRRDPNGVVLAIDDAQPTISRMLQSRLQRTLPDVVDRIQFLPRRPRLDYLNVVALADVMLDTLHYGGGANSLYDAFACGTPVVTLPSEYHRGRYAAGAYRKLEMTELVASDSANYAAVAVRVAAEPDYRAHLSRQIRERSHLLFEDEQAVREHETFFLDAISRSREFAGGQAAGAPKSGE